MRMSSLVPLLAALVSPAFLLAEEQTLAPTPVPVPTTAPVSVPTTTPVSTNDTTQMIVTANRHVEPLSRSIASTNVVTAEDVRERGYQPFMHDWLRGLPGVDVNQGAGGFSSTTQVRLRGAKFGETRFLRDGIPVTDATSSDGNPSVESLDASGIQQVEVVRGSQSGLYGSNANGGVVNLIGIRPTDTAHSAFQLDAGSHATVAGSAQVTGPINDTFGFAVNIGGLSSEGFSNGTTADAKGDPRHYENDGLQRIGGGARLEAHNDHGLVYLSGNVQKADQDYDSFLTVPPFSLDPEDKTSKQEVSSWRVAGGGEWRAAKSLLISGDAARTTTDRAYPNEPFFTKDYHAEDSYAGVRALAQLPANFSATVGIDGNWQHADLIDASGTNEIDRGAHIIGVWSTVTYDLPWLSLSATGRHDDHTSEGSANTYRLGAATFWLEQQYKVFASLGSGFRAPTLYELYAPFYGNQDLQAQTSTSADLGQTITVHGTGLSMTNTWFITDYQNAIDFDPNTFQSVNLPSSSQIRGIENALGWSQEFFSLDTVYTYQHSDDGTGKRLAQLPDHKLNLAGTVRAYDAWLRIGMERQWSRLSRGQTLDAYTLLSASIGYEFTKDWTIYARAENLTDERYEISPSYSTARRAAYGGVAARF
jgi:vitamin B12 transporter